MNTDCVLDEDSNQEFFAIVTDEEIIHLWRSIKGSGISENEAWNAVVNWIRSRHGIRQEPSLHGRQTVIAIGLIIDGGESASSFRGLPKIRTAPGLDHMPKEPTFFGALR
jgi:hypothetical protein